MFSQVAIVATAIFLGRASAELYEVTVGGTAGNKFVPDTVTAGVGDEIMFNFDVGKHSVAQGAFSSACTPGDIVNPFFSGLITGDSSLTEMYSIILTDLEPIYFYCTSSTHCQEGMVGVINPPASGNTLEAYKMAAMGATEIVAPKTVGYQVGKSPEDDTTDGSTNDVTSGASISSLAPSTSTMMDMPAETSISAATTTETPSMDMPMATNISSGTEAVTTTDITASETATPKPSPSTVTTSGAFAMSGIVLAVFERLVAIVGAVSFLIL